MRGAGYLTDRQKQQSEPPIAPLASLDVFEVPEPTFHMARFLPNVKAREKPFYFVMQVSKPVLLNESGPCPVHNQCMCRKEPVFDRSQETSVAAVWDYGAW